VARGRFIAVDGIDGSGKSTQVRLLCEWLAAKGFNVQTTFEPGATPVGSVLRNLLLDGSVFMSPESELLLFCADRKEHQIKVESLLDEGVWVVTDRFLASTWAYQIFGRSVAPELLEALIPYTVTDFPSLTIILDLDVEMSARRYVSRCRTGGKQLNTDRFESEGNEFLNAVRRGFLWYADCGRFGEVVLIDASNDEQTVFKRITGYCEDFFGI
jgi:dTMP kinase